jgi:hypothetical protein
MVVFLLGDPNNVWDEYWESMDSLDGDHMEDDINN